VVGFPGNRVPTGQGKLEKVREFEWSGKVRETSEENIFFGKVRENEKCFCHSNGARTAFRDALLSACTVVKHDITVINRLENSSKYCTFLL